MSKSASPSLKSRNSISKERSSRETNVDGKETAVSNDEESPYLDREKLKKIFSRMLGSTADETILAGLQPLIDIYQSSQNDLGVNVPEHNKKIKQWFDNEYSELNKELGSKPSPVSLKNILERQQTLEEIRKAVEKMNKRLTHSSRSLKLNIQETSMASFDSFKTCRSNQSSATSSGNSFYVKPSQFFREIEGPRELCNSRKVLKNLPQNVSTTTARSTSPIRELPSASLGTPEISSTVQSVCCKKLSPFTGLLRIRKYPKSNLPLNKQMKTYQCYHLTTKLQKFHQIQDFQSNSPTSNISDESTENSKFNSLTSQQSVQSFCDENEDSISSISVTNPITTTSRQSDDESQKSLALQEPYYLKSPPTKSTDCKGNNQQITDSQSLYGNSSIAAYMHEYNQLERSLNLHHSQREHNQISRTAKKPCMRYSGQSDVNLPRVIKPPKSVSTNTEHSKRSTQSRRLHHHRYGPTSIASQTSGKFIRGFFSHNQYYHSRNSRASSKYPKSHLPAILIEEALEMETFEKAIQTSLPISLPEQFLEPKKYESNRSLKPNTSEQTCPSKLSWQADESAYSFEINEPQTVGLYPILPVKPIQTFQCSQCLQTTLKPDPISTTDSIRSVKSEEPSGISLEFPKWNKSTQVYEVEISDVSIAASRKRSYCIQNIPPISVKPIKSSRICRPYPQSNRSSEKSIKSQSVLPNKKQSVTSEISHKLIRPSMLKKDCPKAPFNLCGNPSYVSNQLNGLTSRSNISTQTQVPFHKSTQGSEAIPLQTAEEKSENPSIWLRNLSQTCMASQTPPRSRIPTHCISSKAKPIYVSRRDSECKTTMESKNKLIPKQSRSFYFSNTSKRDPRINILIKSSRYDSRSIDFAVRQPRTSLMPIKSEIDIDTQEINDSYKARHLSLKDQSSNLPYEADNVNLEHSLQTFRRYPSDSLKKTLDPNLSAKSCQMINSQSNKSCVSCPSSDQTSKSMRTFVHSSDKSLQSNMQIEQSIKSVKIVSQMEDKSCQHVLLKGQVVLSQGTQCNDSYTIPKMSTKTFQSNSSNSSSQQMETPQEWQFSKCLQSVDNPEKSTKLIQTSNYGDHRQIDTNIPDYSDRKKEDELRPNQIFDIKRIELNKTLQHSELPSQCRKSLQTLRQQSDVEIQYELPKDSIKFSTKLVQPTYSTIQSIECIKHSKKHSNKSIQHSLTPINTFGTQTNQPIQSADSHQQIWKPLEMLQQESEKMCGTPNQTKYSSDKFIQFPPVQRSKSAQSTEQQLDKSMKSLYGSEDFAKFIQIQNWHADKSSNTQKPPGSEKAVQSVKHRNSSLKRSAKPDLSVASLQTLRDEFYKSHNPTIIIPEPSLKIQSRKKSRRQKFTTSKRSSRSQLRSSSTRSTPLVLGDGIQESLSEDVVYNTESEDEESVHSLIDKASSSFASLVGDQRARDNPSIGHSHFVNSIDEETSHRKSRSRSSSPETSKKLERHNFSTETVSILASVNTLHSSHERPYRKTSISASADKSKMKKSRKRHGDYGDIPSRSRLPHTKNEELHRISEEKSRRYHSPSQSNSDTRSRGFQTTSLQKSDDRSPTYQTSSLKRSGDNSHRHHSSIRGSNNISHSYKNKTKLHRPLAVSNTSIGSSINSSSSSKRRNNIYQEPFQRSRFLETDDKSDIFSETHDYNLSLYEDRKERNVSVEDSNYRRGSKRSQTTHQKPIRPLQGNYSIDHASACQQWSSLAFSEEMVPKNHYKWNHPESSPAVRSAPDVPRYQDHELKDSEKHIRKHHRNESPPEQIKSKRLIKSNFKGKGDESRRESSHRQPLVEDENESPQSRRGPVSSKQSISLSLETVQEESTEELPVRQKANKIFMERPVVAGNEPFTYDVQYDGDKRSASNEQRKSEKAKEKLAKKEQKEKEKLEKKRQGKLDQQVKKETKRSKCQDQGADKDCSKERRESSSSYSDGSSPGGRSRSPSPSQDPMEKGENEMKYTKEQGSPNYTKNACGCMEQPDCTVNPNNAGYFCKCPPKDDSRVIYKKGSKHMVVYRTGKPPYYDDNPDVYRRIFGPTPDETIIAGMEVISDGFDKICNTLADRRACFCKPQAVDTPNFVAKPDAKASTTSLHPEQSVTSFRSGVE